MKGIYRGRWRLAMLMVLVRAASNMLLRWA